ncbi:hypothetical protein Zmor_024859 [Zophobas morio]|uniref:Uncharacterized protein n=1 Tax=Zophobas morio TaxID=2755281 RepID=A0AA38M403_9CUCU|nr:hypothetical protein Zmor_024859 [Zophobas morio]
MDFICVAMIGDSSSITAAGWRSLKKSLEAEVAMGAPDKSRTGEGTKTVRRLGEGGISHYSVVRRKSFITNKQETTMDLVGKG